MKSSGNIPEIRMFQNIKKNRFVFVANFGHTRICTNSVITPSKLERLLIMKLTPYLRFRFTVTVTRVGLPVRPGQRKIVRRKIFIQLFTNTWNCSWFQMWRYLWLRFCDKWTFYIVLSRFVIERKIRFCWFFVDIYSFTLLKDA